MCTDSLEEFHQMSENKCDLPCPGNFSQICGSFLASSVYKIKCNFYIFVILVYKKNSSDQIGNFMS